MIKICVLRGRYFRESNLNQIRLDRKKYEITTIASKDLTKDTYERCCLLEDTSILWRITFKLLAKLGLPEQYIINLTEHLRSYEIIITTEPYTYFSYFALRYALKKNMKIYLLTGVVNWHAIANGMRIKDYISRYVIRNSDGIIFGNELSKIEFEKTVLSNNKRLILLGNHISDEITQIEIPDKIERSIFFGHKLCKEKGADLIIKSIPLLVKQLSITKITLIGAVFDISQLSRKILAEYVRNGVVTHLIHLDQITYWRQMARHEIFLFPNTTSKHNVEQFGQSVLEAMYLELAVVSTRVGGPSLYLSDENSIFCEETTISSILSAVRKFYQYDNSKIRANAKSTATRYLFSNVEKSRNARLMNLFEAKD
jgi:glycosyltransferase involved in cell wall biosynthesis